MSWRSVRVRLTALVVVVTGLLTLLAATLGAARMQDSLVADVVNAEAEQSIFVDGVFFDEEIEGFEDSFATIEDIFGPDVGFYEDELESLARDLDTLGALDPLLVATESVRESGLPVLTGFGFIAIIGIDGGATTFPAIEPEAYGGPLAFEFNLQDLAFSVFDSIDFFDATAIDDFDFDDELFEELLDEQMQLRATELELATSTATIGGIEFAVVADVSDVVRSVGKIRNLLWVAMPVLIVVAAGVTWILTGQALSPVKAMTQRVGVISGGALQERVPVPETGDEIEELGRTMNAMLDRLEADDQRLREFVSDASHELRSPVAILRSEAEVALRIPDQTDTGEFAEGVLTESLRLDRIVDDLLVLARGDEAGSRSASQAIDVDDIVLAEAGRRRRVPVDVRSVSAGRVQGTRDGCTRVLIHLLDNAARHAQSAVAVGLTTADGTVMLWVDDDGPGIRAEDRSRIFERFTRLEAARTRDTGGAGLGLAVVADTVAAMGGRVDVEDSPLGGARFVVRWPSSN